jgi:hypothetical protein
VQPLVKRQQGPQAERQQARLEQLVVRPAMQPVDVLLVQPLLEAQPPGLLVEQPRAELDRDGLPALPNAALQALEFFSSHQQHQ